MKMNNQMDERQVQINTKAMAWGYGFLCLCLIASMIYNLVTTESLGWEFWALIGACLVTIIARRFLGDVEQPRDIHNRPLPTGSSKEDRSRRKKDYCLQSLLFAAVCTAMDILLIGFGKDDVADLELTQLLLPGLNHWTAVAVSAVVAFVSTFLISYLFDYLIGEYYTVRRYNKMIAELDDDE
jgi:hypothetical protein